jgi:CDP-glucose 4,6-dehydratase
LVSLVTGGAGFSGSHLCRALLQREERVVVLDTDLRERSLLATSGDVERVERVIGDVRNLELVRDTLRRFHVDTVFHLAAQPLVPLSLSQPLATVEVNVLGTCSVLEAIRTVAPRAGLVLASSGAYYGSTDTTRPLDEETAPAGAANLYAPSKLAADAIARAYARSYGLRVATCRFMNTYGPGDLHSGRIVPRAIRNLIDGGAYDFGERDDGSTVLSYLHIRDMADAYLCVADRLDQVAGEAFNFAGDEALATAQLARRISRRFDGRERTPHFSGAPRKARKLLDTKKARRVLGWQPRIALDAGLDDTIAWYRRWTPWS